MVFVLAIRGLTGTEDGHQNKTHHTWLRHYYSTIMMITMIAFPCCLLSTQLFLFTLLSQYYSKIFLINTVLVTVTLLIAAIACCYCSCR